MAIREKPHAAGKVKAGDVTQRVSIEQVAARGVNVKELVEKLIDAAGAEFTTYYYYTILRMYLAGHEDYKEICEDARLEDRAHFEFLSLIHISEPTRLGMISYAVFCLKKKKK